MSLSGPQFGAMSAGPMGSNSYVTPDGTQHHDSHVAGPGFEQHEHSTFRHTVNGQPAGGPSFPSMGGGMGGFGGGSNFHQSSAGGSSFQQGYHSGSAYDMGARSLAPPPPPAPSAFGSSFGASSAGGAWSSHSQSRNSFDTGFHGHHGMDSMSHHSGAMMPSPGSGIGGGLTGPQFGALSTSGPSGVQEYFGADGSHHREVHQSGPGFEHHEHSSAKHTVNGQPVNASAPMGPPAGMGQIGSMMGGGSSFGGAYGGHSSTWGSAWEGGSSSFQRTSSF